jgi:hypothetical protein
METKKHTPLQGGTIHTSSWSSYKPDDKSSMRKGREVLTASGMYPLSFVTQLFHNGQPSHDRKTFEVMTSTNQIGTPRAVASLLAATLYQGNPDRNHKLWNL